MVSNRQQLRDKLEKDLKKQIATATANIAASKVAQNSVEQNLIDAKLDVEANYESLARALASRKLELVKQIDSLGQPKAFFLNANIQSTYLHLGSLQSTLSNLDSFEHGQLLNLQVSVDRSIGSFPPTVPSSLKVNLECEKLKKAITAWGCVAEQSAENETTEIGIAVSKSESVDDFVLMTHEAEDSSSDESDLEVHDYVRIPTTPAVAPWTKYKDSQTGPTNTLNTYSGPWCFGLEQWLDRSSIATPVEDFELLSSEPEPKPMFERELTPSSDSEDGLPDLESLPDTTNEDVKVNQVSIEELEDKESELSMWLKPRNRESAPSVSSGPSILGMIQQEMPPETRSISKVATKNQFFEYPGLRLDQSCWLHRGNSKGLNDLINHSDVSLTLSQKEIIPPTYALPYPFWLKKC